jgi:hypothetical protein
MARIIFRLNTMKKVICVWRLLRDRLPRDEDKSGFTRHSLSTSSLLCDRVWCRWVRVTLIYLLQHLWIDLASSSVLDWVLGGGCTHPLWSFCSVHLFSWWSSCETVVLAARLACLCLGYLEWKKPQSSKIRQIMCTSSWIKSRRSPISGWGWGMLL